MPPTAAGSTLGLMDPGASSIASDQSTTRPTPSPLPHWITSYRRSPYTNIYEICPQEPFLFGTESLYGDWNAELLILGQEVGPADAFVALRDSGHAHPYAHREFRPGSPRYEPTAGRGGAGTNETVFRLAEHLPCAKLYGSAMIGLCRPGATYHGNLPSPGLVREHCVRVLAWVMNPAQMPRLRAAMCLGSLAQDWVSRALRDRSIGPALRTFSTPHPAAHAQAGKYHRVVSTWEYMAREMRWEFKP